MANIAHIVWSSPPVPPVLPAVSLAGPGVIPHGAIVFVHGLTSDPERSWKNQSGKTWQCLMAKDPTLGPFDIYQFRYQTSKILDAPPLEDVVGMLRLQIDGKLSRYHHLVIVAHSLG